MAQATFRRLVYTVGKVRQDSGGKRTPMVRSRRLGEHVTEMLAKDVSACPAPPGSWIGAA